MRDRAGDGVQSAVHHVEAVADPARADVLPAELPVVVEIDRRRGGAGHVICRVAAVAEQEAVLDLAAVEVVADDHGAAALMFSPPCPRLGSRRLADR